MKNFNETIRIDRSKLQPIVDAALKSGRMISTIDMPKDVWLGLRNILGIGGSEAAVVLGISKYKTPYQLWKEKVSDEIENIENKFTIWGNLLEEPIAQEYMRKTGMKVVPDNKIRIHPDYDCLFVNLDRVIKTDDGKDGVLECKSTVKRVFDSWQKDEENCPQGIPLNYYVQVQHELSVSGLTWADLAFAILDDRETKIIRIERDEEYIARQNQALVGWWNAYVVPNVAPPFSVAEYSFVEPMQDSFIEATGEIAELYANLKQQKEIKKGLEKTIEEMEEKIKEFIGEKENLVLIDKIIATWKLQSRTTIDSKKLKSEMPEIYQKFSKTSSSRVFRLKDI